MNNTDIKIMASVKGVNGLHPVTQVLCDENGVPTAFNIYRKVKRRTTRGRYYYDDDGEVQINTYFDDKRYDPTDPKNILVVVTKTKDLVIDADEVPWIKEIVRDDS